MSKIIFNGIEATRWYIFAIFEWVKANATKSFWCLIILPPPVYTQKYKFEILPIFGFFPFILNQCCVNLENGWFNWIYMY